jgi:Transposase DDE domain
LTQVLPALTFHVMKGAGTLGEHFTELFEAPLADSSLADRRARLPWEIFTDLMRRMLRPRATAAGEPEAFWHGWRLVALDGTQFSLTNAPLIKRQATKARTRRGRAAFAKLPTAVLLEVGLHNPLAAAVGRPGEAESALARTLLPAIPEQALVLADRLYGSGALAAALHAACARVGSHFLVRVPTAVTGRVVESLADGSRVLMVPIKPRHRPTPDVRTLAVREVHVRVARAGHRATTLRLWTSLMDPGTAPALDLARLYAQRWEHELYFREVKRDLRRTDLLRSHTVETAAQEVAAIVLASALLAVERTRAADGTVPVLRVSFAKMLPIVEGMWYALDIAGPVLTEGQKQFILTQMYERMRRHITPKRRARSCPRAVRQPVTGWPRLLKNTSVEGPFEFTVV